MKSFAVVFAVALVALSQAQEDTNTTVVISEEQIAEFHAVIAAGMEKQGIRGAAYAFRGPGMNESILGAYGQTAGSDDSPPVDIDTAFMLASLSKSFTGAAVGVLVDQGIITLDDDICNAIGEVNSACRNPAFPDTAVTWRMLLTHRSSMNSDAPLLDDGSNPMFGPTGVNYIYPVKGNPTCPIDDVEQFYEDYLVDKETETTVGQGDGLNVNWYQFAQQKMGGAWNFAFPPGQVKMYSNLGTGYLSALVPKVAGGTEFRDFTQQHIFDPLGMNNTAWFRETLPNGTITAMPVYAKSITNGTWEDVGYYCWANYATGQLYSSINDMALWAEAQLGYGINTLWSEETAMNHIYGCQERDFEGTLLEDSDPFCELGVCWEKAFQRSSTAWDKFDWNRAFTRSGSEVGAAAYMLVLPGSQSYVIVLVNTDGADETYLAEGVVEEGMGILLGEGSPDYFGIRGDGEETNVDSGFYDDGSIVTEVERSSSTTSATSTFTVILP